MIYLQLFIEFFKTGLFATGGGMATIPFFNDMAMKYPWFTQAELTDMIAIAESTPGPIGVNIATFAGFRAAGVPGALFATFALVLPCYIIILLIYKALERYQQSPIVKGAFSGLRPAATGLIAAAFYSVLLVALSGAGPMGFSIPAVCFFALILALTNLPKLKSLHPIAFIALAAAAGILLKL